MDVTSAGMGRRKAGVSEERGFARREAAGVFIWAVAALCGRESGGDAGRRSLARYAGWSGCLGY
jgi:hypothetical protein